jgi:hypothetical protein
MDARIGAPRKGASRHVLKADAKAAIGLYRSLQLSLAVDLGFVAGLLVIAATLLLVLRGSTWLESPVFLGVMCAIAIGWIALWIWTVRYVDGPVVASPAMDPRHATSDRRMAVAIALILALVVVAFFLPLLMNFWGGADEVYNFQDGNANFWNAQFDQALNRPFVGVPTFFATLITPDRIEGYLFVAAGLVTLNMLLLVAIIRRLLPGTAVALAAAALLVVNRADPLHFYVMWASNFYWSALFWFLLGLYLLLKSEARGQRWLLAGACTSLGAALLTSEGIFPLVFLGPVLLYIATSNRRRFAVWTAAWLGTASLIAVRLVIFLLHGPTYQTKLLATMHADQFLRNASNVLSGILTYFSFPESFSEHWLAWVLAFALTFVAIVIVKDDCRIRPRICLAALGIAALANILALAVFLSFPNTARTQYFAAPAQAALLALAIVLMCSWMPRRLANVSLAAVAALLSANLTARSWEVQQRMQFPIHFEKTVHVFEQIHVVSPRLAKDSILIFVLDDGAQTPLGFNYHVSTLSAAVFGARAIQANYADPLNVVPTFGNDDITFRLNGIRHYRYDQAIAFRLSVDGTLTLLAKLPENLLPTPGMRTGYAPLARLQAGPIDAMRILQYLLWSERPVDIFDAASGIMLGQHWDQRVLIGRQTARWAGNDAELIVNPAGRDRLALRFEIQPEPWPAGQTSELVVLSNAGSLLASVPLTGERQVVALQVPLDPDQVARLRLRIRNIGDMTGDTLPGSFLVLRPDEKQPATWQSRQSRDIVDPADRLRLGANWHAHEMWNAESFRWVDNDAQIIVRTTPNRPQVLHLEAEIGPAYGGKPGMLSVVDDDGRVLAETELFHRQVLRIELPPAPRNERVLHLRTPGGTTRTPGDPRVLNFRVFRVWRDTNRVGL